MGVSGANLPPPYSCKLKAMTSYAALLKHKFVNQVSQHKDFDASKFNAKSCLARGLTQFCELALCRTCDYTARTARIVDKHRVSHKPPAAAQFCVGAPPKKPTFPNADPERLEALETFFYLFSPNV